MWSSASSRPSRDERGVALVEAAIVLPVLFLLILGLFEGGLYFRDDLTNGYVARDAIRVLSTVGGDDSADQLAMQAAYKAGAALQQGGQSIEIITIYRATCAGTAPCATASAPITSTAGIGSPTCTTVPVGPSAGVDGVCNVYNPHLITGAMLANPAYWGCTVSVPGITPLDRFWCPTSRKSTLSDYASTGSDYIGIRVQMTHASVTGLIATGRTLTSESVYRIEVQA
jgi:Flp pilus assembly protein TadG